MCRDFCVIVDMGIFVQIEGELVKFYILLTNENLKRILK